MNEKVKKVFYLGPIVSFGSTRKVSSYLVRSKLYPLEREQLAHLNVMKVRAKFG